MDKKNVRCLNYGLIRLPYFSYNFYIQNTKDDKDILATYNNYFKNNLRLTSKSLFDNLSNIANQKNKLAIENSLLKYLIRASTRTTPYSMLSMVANSNFGQNEDIEDILNMDTKKVIVRPDFEWIIPIINIIENELGLNLKVKLNNTIEIKHDYIINNWVDCAYKDNNFDSRIIKINHTNAIDIIIKNCNTSFVPLFRIIEELSKSYPQLQVNIFKKFVINLVKNQILISDFKQPAISNDYFKDILTRLKEYDEIALYKELQQIYEDIQLFNKNNDFLLINKIEKNMSSLFEVRNYLRVDCYTKPLSIPMHYKKSIEDFINYFLSFSNDSQLSGFILKFREKYHNNAVLLKDFLKYNEDMLKLVEIDNQYYKDLEEKILMNLVKIFCEIEKCEEISAERLFNDIPTNKNQNKGSLEVPFYLLKDKLIYTPMMGSYIKGQSIGRFSYYLQHQKLYIDNEDEVELCFFPSKARILNVIDNYTFRDKQFCYGLAYADTELNINDIYIYCDDNIHFINSKTNKPIHFALNSKINKLFAPEYIKFILNVLEKQNNHFFKVIATLNRVLDKFNETPQVNFNDIVLFPKTWKLESNEYKVNNKIINFDKFVEKFKIYCQEKAISQNVFVGNNDQRLLLDLKSIKQLNILYNLLKSSNILRIEESLFTDQNLLIKDTNNEFYIAEFIAQVNYGNKKDLINPKDITGYITQNDIFNNMKLFNDNWISCKIYMDASYSNEFLKKDLITFLKKLKFEKTITHFYYLRYKDPNYHLRVRIKYNTQCRNDVFDRLSDLIGYMRKKQMIYNFNIDTYFPEINRYGGIHLIEKSEELFYYDSLLVCDILNFHDLYENIYSLDELFILTTFEIIKSFKLEMKEILEILSPYSKMNFSKKEKRKFKEKISNKISINNKDMTYNKTKDQLDLYIIYSKVDQFMQAYGKELNKYNYKEKENIIRSIIHMHHNRLLGINRNKENFLLSVLENIMYSELKKTQRIV